MAFRKFPRSCKTEPGWRLATVDEVRNSLESIKQDNLLNEFERARLLDGWMGGSSDEFYPKVGFRSCLGYMLLVPSTTPDNVRSSDDIVMDRYSDVKLDEEGMRAAIFLCCEDWNYEVVYWLLDRWSKDENHKFGSTGEARRLSDMMLATSEKVSKMAITFHSLRPMKRVRKNDFTRSSMISMFSAIFKEFRERNEFMDDAYWEITALEVGGQCWDEMRLTMDLAGFQEFGFNIKEDWDKIADIVWYVAADALAVFIVSYFVARNLAIDQLSSDQRLVVSIMAHANPLLYKTFVGPDTLWRVVKKAATTANGNCKLFEETIRKEGYGTFSYVGKYGVLNSVLVDAAKSGDADLVERLLEYGVQPLETDDGRKKTALHHAANLRNEDIALRIAKALLTPEKGTSEALANAIDHKQRIPLHRAAFRGHTEVCKLLLDCHSDICSKDSNGQNPLHYALKSYQSTDEVINILISDYRDKFADIDDDTIENRKGRLSLVDEKDSKGKTPIDLAVEWQGDNVRMVSGLLSESGEPEAYFEKLDLASYLREVCRNGNITLVEKFLKSGADPLEKDSEGRTALHYAVEGQNEDNAKKIISYIMPHGEQLRHLELDTASGKQLRNLELLTASDMYGRSALHVAAFVGHADICFGLLSYESPSVKIDTEDRDDQSALYYAVAGHHDDDRVLDALIYGGASGQGVTDVGKENSSGTTPLHIASERGNHKMVAKLLSTRLISQPDKRQMYVRTADVLGQTALHKAASGGHIKVVRKLLEEGAHPLEERDCDRKTALHHAVQAEKEEDAMAIVEFLLNKCDENDRTLLLFASAVGIGYAEESFESKPKLKDLLLKKKEAAKKRCENLVRLAAESGNIDMTRELLTRGASIDDIRIDDSRNEAWISTLSPVTKQNVHRVQKQFVNMVEQGTDKPTLLDNLGRSAFADGLAALFLNPFVKSPITVGISGEWGMGKSSLMIQTESILLKIAAQLAFIDFLQTDDFPGSRKSKVRNKKLRQSIQGLFPSKGNDEIWDFLSKNHQGVLKSLAVIDHGDELESEKEKESGEKDFKSDGKMQGKIPSILTVRYNAWNYRNESQAWAGLAVQITKELESTMTVAQWLRTSWGYTWVNRRRSICVDVILPCCFAILLAIWVTVILWLVLDRVKDAHVKQIKYASFPLTIIAVVWAIVKSVMSVVKPISSHMLDYMCLPDHSQKLGYHHIVTNDIKFLKDKVGRKPFWLWNVFAFIWCCTTFNFKDNYIPHTTIPKPTPTSNDNLRMIVFVDDLDRCQENVVLQILSAVNLVLAACEIDVVLGMDKSMIEKAIIKKHGDESSKADKNIKDMDMADKYLRKIIQLPLDLQDPSDSESLSFLQEQLGVSATLQEASESAAGTQMQTVHATRKLNPKFRIGTSNPKDSKIAGAAINNPRRESGLDPLGVAEEVVDNLDTQSAGEGSTSATKLQEDKRGESGYTQRDAAITMPSDHPISKSRSDIICVGLVKKLISGIVNKQPENPPSDQQLWKLFRFPISSELLLPKYSKGETDALFFLRLQATSSRKLPREWKRFLNYHRLAWNILFKSEEVKAVAGWQVQLIAWVFVCWQWKHRIDTLIKGWDELPVLRKWITMNYAQREGEQDSGPSLRNIVEQYMEQRWPTRKAILPYEFSVRATLPKAATATAKEDTTLTIEKEELEHDSTNRPVPREGQHTPLKGANPAIEEYLKQTMTKVIEGTMDPEEPENEQTQELVKGKDDGNGEEGEKAENPLQMKPSSEKLSEKAEGNGKGKVKEEKGKVKEEWKKLKQTLRKYDVSMDGIQAFQKFRFHCEPGHLHWPLLDSSRV